MSDANTEVVLRVYAEVGARLATPAELFGPDYELDASEVAPDLGVVQGHEAVDRALRAYWEMFQGFHIDVERVIRADETHVVTVVRDGGRIEGSEGEVWNRFFHAWTFRDGQVVRLSIHADESAALEAASVVR